MYGIEETGRECAQQLSPHAFVIYFLCLECFIFFWKVLSNLTKGLSLHSGLCSTVRFSNHPSFSHPLPLIIFLISVCRHSLFIGLFPIFPLLIP